MNSRLTRLFDHQRAHRPRLALLLATAAIPILAAAALAFQRTAGPAPAPTRPASPAISPLAALLPPGALLTIESPDFASLLRAWTSSPQSAAWIHSANHAVFANSRLFARLSDAQDQFASAATLNRAGTSFLQEIAGRQSIFAWYDVGNLEFLYITRLPRAAQTQLFQAQSRFSRRQVGTSVFFVRTETSKNNGPRRTVAFASSGDLLLLATREDLLAHALELLAAPNSQPAPLTDPSSLPPSSVAQEPWYSAALTAAAVQTPPSAQSPDLRMVLNLTRIVPLPYFRTYWIQQNITEMALYSSAVADLFREPTPATSQASSQTGFQLREERTLLLKSPAAATLGSALNSAANSDPNSGPPDLATLATLIPPGTGVFRAFASSDPASAASTLQEKLLGSPTPSQLPSTQAPDATLDPSPQGSAADLETRIDAPQPQPLSAPANALAQAFNPAGLDAILTLDSAGSSQPLSLPRPSPSPATTPTQPGPTLWIPIRSAVVLHTARPLDPAGFQSAIRQSLQASLTVGGLGIDFHTTTPGINRHPGQILTLNGPKPLFLAFAGNLCLLANDQPLLVELLSRIIPPSRAPSAASPAKFPPAAAPLTVDAGATLIAGFNLTTQRRSFARLTALIDGPTQASQSPPASAVNQHEAPSAARSSEDPDPSPDTPQASAPPFFSGNIRSLANSFPTLQSEHILTRRIGNTLHQTVISQWNP